MAPHIYGWREKVRQSTWTDLTRREPQVDFGKGHGGYNTKIGRDDSDSSGGRAGLSGGVGGGGDGDGDGYASSSGHGNGGVGGSGRGHNDDGAGGGGGGQSSGNSDNNNVTNDNADNDSSNGKNGNSGNDDGDGGDYQDTDNNQGSDNGDTSPPVALSPEDAPVSYQAASGTTTVAPAATAIPSSTPVPHSTGFSSAIPDYSSYIPGYPSSIPDFSSAHPDPSIVAYASAVTAAPSAATSLRPTFVPLTTTTIPPDTDASAPEEGLYNPALSVDYPTLSNTLIGTALADSNPTPTAFAISEGMGDGGTFNNNEGKGDGHRGNGNDGPRNKGHKGNQSSLSPTTERALISVASIGGFVLVCFVIWLMWQIFKKTKARKDGAVSSTNSTRRRRLAFPDRVLAKVPFFRNRQRQWQDLDDSSVTGVAPPSYKSGMSRTEPGTEFYAQEKTYQLPSMNQSMDQSNNARQSSSSLAQNLPILGLTSSPPSLNNTDVRGSDHQPTSAAKDPPSLAYTNSPVTLKDTDIAQPRSHEPQLSLSTTNAVQLGNMPAPADETETLRSRMPDAYYNQSELARGPSNAYDPARRQVNRVSELSSISSGFGDGDIIVPDNNTPKPPQPGTTSMRQSTSIVGRFSWLSRGGRSSQRDTVYTQSSEDSPPRFRSISSWVNQQTGRIKRAQQRQEEDGRDAPPVPALSSQQMGVPGIHNPPAEPSFNLMMADDEVPRRVEDTIVSPPR